MARPEAAFPSKSAAATSHRPIGSGGLAHRTPDEFNVYNLVRDIMIENPWTSTPRMRLTMAISEVILATRSPAGIEADVEDLSISPDAGVSAIDRALTPTALRCPRSRGVARPERRPQGIEGRHSRSLDRPTGTPRPISMATLRTEGDEPSDPDTVRRPTTGERRETTRARTGQGQVV